MTETEQISIWPTVGWEMLAIDGTALTALCFLYRSHPTDRTVESRSNHFAMSPEQMRRLASALTAAAEVQESGGKPAVGAAQH